MYIFDKTKDQDLMPPFAVPNDKLLVEYNILINVNLPKVSMYIPVSIQHVTSLKHTISTHMI